jgi:hypothetical protein
MAKDYPRPFVSGIGEITIGYDPEIRKSISAKRPLGEVD